MLPRLYLFYFDGNLSLLGHQMIDFLVTDLNLLALTFLGSTICVICFGESLSQNTRTAQNRALTYHITQSFIVTAEIALRSFSERLHRIVRLRTDTKTHLSMHIPVYI